MKKSKTFSRNGTSLRGYPLVMYMRPYVSLIVVFQKKKTATNVYIKKKITKIVKKKHSHSYALSTRNRIVIDRQALATGARDVLVVKPLRY